MLLVDCLMRDVLGEAAQFRPEFLAFSRQARAEGALRGVIQTKDILRCNGNNVTCRWLDSKTKRLTTRTVSGAQFLRLVMHVLPKGFRRARNFGFLHPNSKRLIALLKLLVFNRPSGTAAPSATSQTTPRAQWTCACCAGAMRELRRRILPSTNAPPPQHSQATTKQ